MSANTLLGLDVQVSPALPIVPSPGEDARRIVRHGLAKYIKWCLPNENVGPKPGHVQHVFLLPRDHTILVSNDFYQRLRMSVSPVDGVVTDPATINEDMHELFQQRHRALWNGEPL